MEIWWALLLLFAGAVCSPDTKKTPTAVTRTELKVSRSLNPEETQTLNVATRDGGVAQLIVKRRNSKTSTSSTGVASHSAEVPDSDFGATGHYSRSIYANWIPISSVYYRPNLITLEKIAVVRNASEPFRWSSGAHSFANVIDSDRIPHVPKPVTVRSKDVFVKGSFDQKKKSRSLTNVDEDGIPVVHGVRVPDDENDKKQTWRNARVINGELVPYEDGYRPPAAVPLGGELVYANRANDDETGDRGIGPFVKEDNFRVSGYGENGESIGPFTVDDNKRHEKHPHKSDVPKGRSRVRFDSRNGLGPFTVADNKKFSSASLIDYIKKINEKESKRDYFSNRKYRSYETTDEFPQHQIQRRMLHYSGSPSYANSLMYTPTTAKLSPVNFMEGVRTPVLQYAHPELGVQPARASAEDDDSRYGAYKKQDRRGPENQIDYTPYVHEKNKKPHNPDNEIGYYRKDIATYPYGGYFVRPNTEQPFWMKITDSIKDNVQNGFERMQQLTRPVFEPLVEATQKISHNLGLAKTAQSVQEKVGLVAPIGASVILPALGLVAGGAALGLGAAAVGRFLQPEEMRRLDGMHDIFVIMEDRDQMEGRGQNQQRKRFVRSLDGEGEGDMQELGASAEVNGLRRLAAAQLWSDTPCSKRLFCDVMLQQGEDEIVFMEKKMEGLLSAVHPEVVRSVSHHLQEVMEAVKMKNCSKFRCSRFIPTIA